ncbi:MAG TPA: type 4a pilus biogenesis protein PilO [Candidatus Saccharimonadales bacterium]|nr:type 4a pilus biogenesis protein PilO [Candidatus Saccharimonadales bacterium]
MKPKQFSYFLLGLLGVLLVLGTAGYYFASASLRQRTELLRTRLAEAAVADERIAQLSGLKQQYQKLEPLLPKITAAIPKTKQQSEIALQLQQLATQAGMPLPGITFPAGTGLPSNTSQTTKAGNVLALPISFQLTGSYEQLQAFLTSLERLNRYTTVTSLAIAKPDPRSNKLSLTFNVNVFVKP